MSEIHRVGVLLLTQATQPDPSEDVLLRDDVVDYRPAPSTSPHQNSTNVADLRSGVRGFHKPLAGVRRGLAAQYGHEPVSVGLNECAAWRLARLLGPPYSEMVPATVLRWHAVDDATKLLHPRMVGGWGSLSIAQPGVSLERAPLESPAINDAAAFFDALIAQQDRHAGQYRWDARSSRLGLIDHGFAFARAGDLLNQSVFLARRHADGRAALRADEADALARIEQSHHLAGLREILLDDQADALADRIARMRATGELIHPGDW